MKASSWYATKRLLCLDINNMLTNNEKQRYQKHLLLAKVGIIGQEKLKAARVLIVGAGGLGCPVLLYLAAAGVGKIGLIDNDTVDLSNLQRQVLYAVNDIGQAKVAIAAQKLQALNDSVELVPMQENLHAGNAQEYIQQYDLVVDCTDNFPTRYLINDFCVQLNKPFVYGAIHEFEGQVSVFNFTNSAGIQGPTYRCLFPEQPSELEIPNCATNGVLGILPGALGMYQANEVVKMITGIGNVLSGELLMLDLLENTSQKIRVKRRADAETLIFPVYETATPSHCTITMLPPEISVEELAIKLDEKEDLFLLDVRNMNEYEICHLADALLIPMNTIPEHLDKIPKDKPVIVYCHHGMRSASVIRYLQQNHGYTNLSNLVGGIHAWAVEIDETMEVYQ